MLGPACQGLAVWLSFMEVPLLGNQLPWSCEATQAGPQQMAQDPASLWAIRAHIFIYSYIYIYVYIFIYINIYLYIYIYILI
jgi:hypothetical protein